VHRDRLLRREDLETADVAETTVVGADEEHGDAELVVGATRAGDDLAGGLVTPEGVDGDREDQSTSIAWRPLYQPQFGQTTCGSLACWQ
jgi:hypothetical protein